MNSLCPCKSGKLYQECCKHYHDGFPPEHALNLMRSRYSAYAMHLADYIIKTTHPKNPHYQLDQVKWKEEILRFSNETRFEGLTILQFIDGKESAYVTFIAHLIADGQDRLLTEKSLFVKEGEWWLYLDCSHL